MLEKILVNDPLEIYTVILQILHNNYLIQFGVFLFQWSFYSDV